MAAITSQNVAQAIAKIVVGDALPALRANLVMGSIINRNYDTTIATPGDVVNIPIPGVMVANTLGEGASVQTQNPGLGNASVVLDRHIEATFSIPDVTKLLATPDLLKVYLGPAVIALAEKIETDLFNLYTNFTFNTPVGTGGAGLASESVIDSAEKALFKAKVPGSMRRYLAVTPDAYSDLRQVPRFSENLTNGNGSTINSGTVGQLKGFDIFRSQLVPIVAGTSFNIAFAPDALTLVTRRFAPVLGNQGVITEEITDNGYTMRLVMSYQANQLSQQFTVHILYGVAVLRNAFGIQVLS